MTNDFTWRRRALGFVVVSLLLLLPAESWALIVGTQSVSGSFVVGGTATYTVVLSNTGQLAQPDNLGPEFFETLPAGLALVTATASSGSAVATVATNLVSWDGTIPGAGSVTITITATINVGQAGQTISAQGAILYDADLNGTNESTAFTDDPVTVAQDDPTSFNVAPGANVHGTQTVAGNFVEGGTITYTVTLPNTGGPQADNPGNEFFEQLPASITLVSAVATSGTAVATVATNTVTWNGSIPGGGSVTITITATINANTGGTTISAQGETGYDTDGNGTNDTILATDDPSLPGATDATVFQVAPNLVRGICTIQDAPASTLLIPYFEVGGSDGNSPNTIISIGNSTATAVLAHVTLWSDLSVHVLDFNVYLTGYDVQNINLGGLVFAGASPRTASLGQDPGDAISPKGTLSQDINFASCSTFLPLPALPANYKSHVIAALTGQPDPFLGGQCVAQNFGDGILRGYVTIDTVNACTNSSPGDAGYFTSGNVTGVVTDQNVLFGNVTYVNRVEGKAHSEPAVHVEANSSDTRLTTPGNYTFYGRYVNWTAADHREPLATKFAARYAQNTAGAVFAPQYFTQGSSLLVWRDSKVATSQNGPTGAFACPAQLGSRPSWYPLGQEQIIIFDDQEHPVVPTVVPFSPQPPQATLIPFPAETQRVKVGGAKLPVPWGQGWLYLDLNTFVAAAGNNPPADPLTAQAWVSTLMENASPSWRVGVRATQLDSACDANHILIP